MIYIILISLLCLILLYKYIIKPYLLYKKYKQYGDGYFYPLIGELAYQMDGFNKHNDLEYHYKHLQDNRKDTLQLFVENIAGDVKVKICDPELLKDFFIKLNDYYEADMFYVQNFERLMGKGLVFSTGEQWKRMRQNMSSAFHYEYLKSLTEQINLTVDQVYQTYSDSTPTPKSNNPSNEQENKMSKVDVIAMMANITSQVIVFSYFGDSLSEVRFRGMSLTKAITDILQKIAAEVGQTSYLLFGSKFLSLGLFKSHRQTEQQLQEFKQFLKGIIHENINILTKEYQEKGKIEQKNNCLLAKMIMDGSLKNMTEKELMDNFMTLFIAGTDTTSNLVGMTIYYLSQHQHIYKSLQSEVDQYYCAQPLQPLAQQPLLNAVLKETQRFYGPGNSLFDRKALQDHYIGNIKIEKGIIVNYQGQTIHRNPNFYKDPHTYNPQRWLNGETNNLPSFAFVPFSGGKRNCIGQHLALIEARIMLSKFIQKYDFECENNYVLKMFNGLVPQPETPLQINLKLRRKQ